MNDENKVWVITYREWDNSDAGIVGNFAYENWQAAQHIKNTLCAESSHKEYKLVELALVQGDLK